METTSLYDLPKDMLIKIITTSQDSKNLDNGQLEKNIKSSIEEMEKRKLFKLKEIFLQRSQFKDYFSLANSIQVVRLRRPKDSSRSVMEIIFEDDSGIKIKPESQIYSATIFNNKGIDICIVVGKEYVSWEGDYYQSENSKYNIYIQFFRDVVFGAFDEVCYYLDSLTEIDDC